MRVEQPFANAIQGNVMVARDDNQRNIRQALQEQLGIGELMRLRALR